MKDAWKGILVISAVLVAVPWAMSGFAVDTLDYWLQVAMALVLAGVLVSPLITLIEKRIGKGLAALVALLLLPELVLLFHFYLLPSLFGAMEG